MQLVTAATHSLESQGWASWAGTKCSPSWKPLTFWRARDRPCEQGPNTAHHGSHPHPEEPSTGVMSRVQIQLTTGATHILESQGQVLSTECKSSSPWKPLTNWGAKDRHCQQ